MKNPTYRIVRAVTDSIEVLLDLDADGGVYDEPIPEDLRSALEVVVYKVRKNGYDRPSKVLQLKKEEP